MKNKAWLVFGACAVSLGAPEVAQACGGGGVVSTRPESIGADAQRVLIAVHDDGVGGGADGTDVVTQITVPATTEDYGVLLPLPSEPTLDPNPVSAAELEQLDKATAPEIGIADEDSDGGWSCGCGSASEAGGGTKGDGVRVSEPVDIGPVTAVTLAGTTDAVNGWLDENGFVISEAAQATI